jgi:hypothetical protein
MCVEMTATSHPSELKQHSAMRGAPSLAGYRPATKIKFNRRQIRARHHTVVEFFIAAQSCIQVQLVNSTDND